MEEQIIAHTKSCHTKSRISSCDGQARPGKADEFLLHPLSLKKVEMKIEMNERGLKSPMQLLVLLSAQREDKHVLLEMEIEVHCTSPPQAPV